MNINPTPQDQTIADHNIFKLNNDQFTNVANLSSEKCSKLVLKKLSQNKNFFDNPQININESRFQLRGRVSIAPTNKVLQKIYKQNGLSTTKLESTSPTSTPIGTTSTEQQSPISTPIRTTSTEQQSPISTPIETTSTEQQSPISTPIETTSPTSFLDSIKIIDSSNMDCSIKNENKNNQNIQDIQEELDSIYEGLIEPERKTLMIGDILSKGLAYCRITKEARHIDIPQLINNEWIKVKYKILPWDLTDNNLAYILEPASLVNNASNITELKPSPLILIRGTKPSLIKGSLHTSIGFRSVLNFIKDGSLNFGSTVLRKKKLEFRKILEELKNKYSSKPTVLGHSLGGTLALRFTAQEDNTDLISLSMAFNSPGITASELQSLEKKEKNGDESIAFKAITVNTKNDFVNLLAEKRFFGKKFIFNPTEKFKKIHGKTLLGRAGKIKEVKNEKSLHNLNSSSEKIKRLAINIFKFIAYRLAFRLVITSLLVFKSVIIETVFFFLYTKKSINRKRIEEQNKLIQSNHDSILKGIEEQFQKSLYSEEEYSNYINNKTNVAN